MTIIFVLLCCYLPYVVNFVLCIFRLSKILQRSFKFPDSKDSFITIFDSSLVHSVLDMAKSSSNAFVKMQGLLGPDSRDPGMMHYI